MLTEEYYNSLLPCLVMNDVVLTKAEDGGVVMMATSKPWPDLIELPWSSQYLGNALASSCLEHEMSLSYHQHGYDIDEFSNLKRLSQDLLLDRRPARQDLLMRLNACFNELEGKNYA